MEHPAVSACAEELRRMGHQVTEIPAKKNGSVDLAALESMMSLDTAMISVMQVNNETGALEPLEEIAALRNRICPGAAIHVDGVQGFLRVPLRFRKLGIQSYALSAHKIHGLKGTGALILAENHPVKPLAFGGGQEGNLRSGTENTFGILALGEAVRQWNPEDTQRIRILKNKLWSGIRERIADAVVNGPAPDSEYAAPHILNIALEPVRSHRHAYACAADKYAEVGLAGGHGLGDFRRVVRIVAACLVGRAHVDDLRGARKGVDESGLQFYAAMVGTNRNVHLVFLGVVACRAKCELILYQICAPPAAHIVYLLSGHASIASRESTAFCPQPCGRR